MHRRLLRIKDGSHGQTWHFVPYEYAGTEAASAHLIIRWAEAIWICRLIFQSTLAFRFSIRPNSVWANGDEDHLFLR